jgi:Fic family protein
VEVVHSSTTQIEGNTDAVRDLEIKTDGGNFGAGTERKEIVKFGNET